MIKKLSLFLMLIWAAFLNAQNDTILIKGNSRNYGNSIYLRWNTTNALDYLVLTNSKIYIEKQAASEKEMRLLKVIQPLDFKDSKNKNKRNLALAYMLNNPKPSDNSIGSQVRMADEINQMWGVLSVLADLNKKEAMQVNLGFVDENINKGEAFYTYKLYIEAANVVSDTVTFIVFPNSYQKLKPQFSKIVGEEGAVKIDIENSKDFTAYFLEKTKNFKDSFMSINETPILPNLQNGVKGNLSYKDQVGNYNPHYYRCLGVDMFGDTSLYSDTIIGMAKDLTPPPFPSGVKAEENDNGTLSVTWNYSEAPSDFRGFIITSQAEKVGPFTIQSKEVLKPDARKFNFPFDKKQSDYFIHVQAFDTAGNSNSMAVLIQLKDNFAPETPKLLSANVDTNGIVTIIWKRNLESDLDGYHVLFANDTESEMSALTNLPIMDTMFRDTLSLKMLNTNVYYALMATDKRVNLSPKTPNILIKRPDKLPPVAPMVYGYYSNDTGIYLKFVASSSVDVKQHFVLRLDGKNKTKIMLENNATIFKDTTALAEGDYEYQVYALDSSNNVSLPSNAIKTQRTKKYFLPAISNLTAEYDSTKNQVVLNWSCNQENIKKAVIYKGLQPNKISESPIECFKNQAYDTKVSKLNYYYYYYAIKVYFLDGTSTILSKPIEVFVN